MRIESVEAIPVEIPLRWVFSGGGYRVAGRNTVITRIRIAGGLASEVDNGDNPPMAAPSPRLSRTSCRRC